ncbi:MAG: type I-E CRISPR-associated protein Cas7/Cse4/CasC [Syntrophomonadaceae bacterium]|nr:type I-E CRISPR-associated protein Cas7/Cse4/CasC [Syntrophomonadaceae bacterium]
MFIEVHMLKNYAPSNLNRDDTGSPKSCLFGGVPRGRISSQCQKRTVRTSDILRDAVGIENLGLRTRKLPKLIVDELAARGIGEEYLAIVRKKITGFGNKEGKESKDDLTAQIMFFSPADIAAAAECVHKSIKEAGSIAAFEKVKAKDLQSDMRALRPITLDIALFGRMITSDAFRDVEAAMQVAHAFSTNRLEQEFDYYTAMDDLLAQGEETGAGMIGDVEFNSNCYYHYFNLDVDQLLSNLDGVEAKGELVIKAIPALIRAFAYSSPSGKQNSFAAHQLPSVVCVEIKKEKIPVSYANAFVKPAYAGRESNLIDDSILKLVKEIDRIDDKFDIPLQKRLWFCTEEVAAPSASQTLGRVAEVFDSVSNMLREAI